MLSYQYPSIKHEHLRIIVVLSLATFGTCVRGAQAEIPQKYMKSVPGVEIYACGMGGQIPNSFEDANIYWWFGSEILSNGDRAGSVAGFDYKHTGMVFEGTFGWAPSENGHRDIVSREQSIRRSAMNQAMLRAQSPTYRTIVFHTLVLEPLTLGSPQSRQMFSFADINGRGVADFAQALHQSNTLVVGHMSFGPPRNGRRGTVSGFFGTNLYEKGTAGQPGKETHSISARPMDCITLEEDTLRKGEERQRLAEEKKKEDIQRARDDAERTRWESLTPEQRDAENRANLEYRRKKRLAECENTMHFWEAARDEGNGKRMLEIEEVMKYNGCFR